MKKRLLGLYLVLVVLPILTLSIFALHSSFQSFEETVKGSARSSCQQTRLLLEYYINNVKDTINTLLSSDEFHKILEKDNENTGTKEQIQDMLYLRKLLGTCSSRSEIDDVLLYLDNHALYIGENAQTRYIEDVRKEKWYSYVEENYPENVLIPEDIMDNPVQIGYAKAVHSMRNYNRTTGIVLFLLNRSLLIKYLGEDEAAAVFMVDEKGDVIAEKKNVSFDLPQDYRPEEMDGARFEAGGSRWFLFSERMENTDWYLVYLEPYVTVDKLLEEKGLGYLLVFVLIIILGVLLYYFFCLSRSGR